jgi:hypothetical protein
MKAFGSRMIFQLKNKTADVPAEHPKLEDLFIKSVDTLDGTEIDLRVTQGWNDQPPLLLERGSWRKREGPEDPALLKGVSIV